MDIWVKAQTSGDIVIVVPMVLAANTLDTGLTGGSSFLTKCIDPDGIEVAGYTQPTVTEVIASSGVYKLVFLAAAATPCFTSVNALNPYTLVFWGTSATNTGRKVIRVYVTDRLPGALALSTEIAALDTVVDTMATAANLATVDTVVDSILAGMATASALTTVDTVVDSIYSGMALETTLAAVDGVVDGIAATMATATALATVDGIVDTLAVDLATANAGIAALPTLTEIEASTVLAKSAATDFLLKCIKNRKKVKVISGVLYLIIYDDDNTAEILRKAIKDVDGADVADPASGVIAFETKSTV